MRAKPAVVWASEAVAWSASGAVGWPVKKKAASGEEKKKSVAARGDRVAHRVAHNFPIKKSNSPKPTFLLRIANLGSQKKKKKKKKFFSLFGFLYSLISGCDRSLGG